MAGYIEIICGLLAIIILGYYYYKLKFDFWKKRNIPAPRALPFIGTFSKLLRGKTSIGDYLKELYDKYNNVPMFGIFSGGNPILVLRDLDMIKNVLIKDFTHFSDRGLAVCEVAEPLSQTLFTLKPEPWRALRIKLSPTFTSGRLKDMFFMILQCSENLEKYMEKVVEKEKVIEIRDLTAKFTTDVIGTCAFGIDTKALEDEESEFRRMGRKIFTFDLPQLTRLRLRQFAPRLYNWLGYILPQMEVSNFFIRLTMDSLKYRQENNIVRNDFVNTLLELQQHHDKLGNIKLTDSLIASQAFVFFAAGFETSSTTMSNALYELALNQNIQEKLRQEIKETEEKNGGNFEYETLKQMKLLNGVFCETLRKYPPVTVLFRNSVTDYTFEGTDLTIPKNVRIWLPIYAIQRDPNIFPDPEKFDPDRFIDEEALKSRHPMSYLPFGDGPRNCIGARFAVYQSKIGLIKILRKYKVEICEKSPVPYINDPRSFLIAPIGGIHLRMIKIENN